MGIIEFQRFGWNMATFGFIGAMTTALYGFWGIISQARAIWRGQSGKSVPMVMHAYGMLFFASGCVYGFSIGSLALMIMGVRVLLTAPVLIGLWKYQGFRWWEWLLSVVFLSVLAALIVLPQKDTIYFAVAMGAIVSFIPQPMAMLLNRSRGTVSSSLLWSTFIGVAFWSVYSIAIGDWVLAIANPTFLLFVIATLVIWYVLPPAAPEEKNGATDD